EEIRRLLHKAGADTDAPSVNAAVEAYTEGAHREAVRSVARLSALHTIPDGETQRRAAAVLGAMARRRGHDAEAPQPEESLLALLLAKTALGQGA
ncbi:MAG: hypothetical protein H7145_02485, partial [Akkermansiaceae bacterium]|nr:hypothetical protein [Armatimonadota bacterium]